MKKFTLIFSILAMNIANIMAQPTGSESELYYNLGYSYYNGVDGAEPDYYNAVQWLLKAAELGHIKANELLGECYYFGNGVGADINMAINYYYNAAKLGSTSAQCTLGSLYGELGYKEEKDRWLKITAENGDANGQYFLAMYYLLETNRTDSDIEKAMYWYSRAVVGESKVARLEMKKIFKTWLASKNLR